jgi:hypothetical protein
MPFVAQMVLPVPMIPLPGLVVSTVGPGSEISSPVVFSVPRRSCACACAATRVTGRKPVAMAATGQPSAQGLGDDH